MTVCLALATVRLLLVESYHQPERTPEQSGEHSLSSPGWLGVRCWEAVVTWSITLILR
jgi:hypothetical protein